MAKCRIWKSYITSLDRKLYHRRSACSKAMCLQVQDGLHAQSQMIFLNGLQTCSIELNSLYVYIIHFIKCIYAVTYTKTKCKYISIYCMQWSTFVHTYNKCTPVLYCAVYVMDIELSSFHNLSCMCSECVGNVNYNHLHTTLNLM